MNTTTNEQDMTYSMITVPDISLSHGYINRHFGRKTEWEIFDRALADGTNILIEGEAGSGKTIAVQSYASAKGMRYFNVSNSNAIDPSQLFGAWIPRADGQGYRWQDGAVTQIVRHGGVLLLNEVNFLPTRVSTVLFSLLDYRREIQLLENGGEVIKAHKDLLIVADMNYGYKGTQELNQAFNDRFHIKLEFPYDRAIENKVVGNKALLILADQLREQYAKEELSTPISTRSLVAFINNARNFDVDFAIMSFVNGFNREERGGVRLACDTHKDNILESMGYRQADMNYFNEVLRG
jgi:MoxR-like ATPase